MANLTGSFTNQAVFSAKSGEGESVVATIYFFEKETGHRKTIEDIESKQPLGVGGEGAVYEHDERKVIKILNSPEPQKMEYLHKCFSLRQKTFDPLQDVAAVPCELIKNGVGETVGFTMKNLAGWWLFSELQTEDFCKAQGMDLKTLLWILGRLHRSLKLTHKQGFVVGDFNLSNVMFKIENGECQVALIDTDSWGIYRPDLGLNFQPSAMDASILAPDLVEDPSRPKEQKHDWFAFTVIACGLLLKADVFAAGDKWGEDREKRVMRGATVFSAYNRMTRYDTINLVRLGQKMQLFLDRFLKMKWQGEFPLEIIVECYKNIRNCPNPNCGIQLNGTIGFCPKCARVL